MKRYLLTFVLLLPLRAAGQVAPPGNLSPAAAGPAPEISVILQWEPVPSAATYAVRMVDNTDGSVHDPRNNCPPEITYYLCVDGLRAPAFAVAVRVGHQYDWWVHAIDRAGNWSEAAGASFEVPCLAPLTITTRPGGLPDGHIGVPYKAQLEATGGTPPYSWSVLPVVARVMLALAQALPSP